VAQVGCVFRIRIDKRPCVRFGFCAGTVIYNTDPTRPIGDWKEAWEKAKKRAGAVLSGKTEEESEPLKCRFHDLRHTAVTRLLEGGIPYPVVASIMGWSAATAIRMAKRYGHIGSKALRDATDVLGRVGNSRRVPQKVPKVTGGEKRNGGKSMKKNGSSGRTRTFNELLAKLKLLHDFLISHAPEARQASMLHDLETKVLRLQHELHELFECTESRSGSLRIGTSKPLPGVDGKSVGSAIGKLAVLKFGFDRARLQIPPYPVAFDESGDHTIKVQTLDEFIAEAEKAIADADAVLTAQKRSKL